MRLTDQIHGFIWQSMTSNNCNTYLIDDGVRILIDPGHMHHFDHVQTGLTDIGLEAGDIDLVICTHAHGDHIEASQVFAPLPALLTMHEIDWQMVKAMKQQLRGRQREGMDGIVPDFLLMEGDLKVRNLDLVIIHCPGHSPGSISVYWPDRKALFTGDLIFRDGIGRTDLPQGNGRQLKDSIERVSGLDVELLMSGHGEVVSGKDAVIENFDRVASHWLQFV